MQFFTDKLQIAKLKPESPAISDQRLDIRTVDKASEWPVVNLVIRRSKGLYM